MPELPEVETVTRALRVMTKDKTIKSIDIYYDKIIANMNALDFKTSLSNQKIESLSRRGKFIIFHLKDYYLISHLRMEGCYYLKKNNDIDKHEHIIFHLNDGERLVYRDVRKFGRMWVYPKDTDIYSIDPLAKLGYEPFDDIDNDIVYQAFHKSSLPIKELLLDQSIICGIGNIYDAEILYACHINPCLCGCSISRMQVSLIIEATRKIMTKAIEAGGSTIKSFISPLDMHGAFQNEFMAYHCEVCKDCGANLERIKLGGRSSFYCSNCQALKAIKVIGLTGSIACGKSMATEYLLDKGYPVIDCDKLSKIAYNNSIDRISETFKEDDVFADNTLDRQKLGRLVFNNPLKQHALEEIIHPLVMSELLNEVKEYSLNNDIIFCDVPLLFESHLEKMFDAIWVVSTEETQQIARLMERDHITKDYALAKIHSQMAVSLKEEHADVVLKNNKDLNNLYKQIDKNLKKLQ